MKLIIVSGRSGSGKSTVLHILEDRGYYCIDNLPASILPALAERITSDDTSFSRLAVSIDARNISTDLERFPDILAELNSRGLQTEVIFLDANSQTLLKRFSESRRKHPLSNDKTGLREAINKESDLLEPLSLLASLSIDTSDMSLHTLRDTVKKRVVEHKSTSMALLFLSFGFKNGVPMDADIVYDVRCLPNPYWNTALRRLTGTHPAVQEYLGSQQEVQEMQNDISNYLEKWLPRFEQNNRSYMTVAIGCTGGQHRSVYLCEKLGQHFASRMDDVLVRHRELGQ